jgi:type VI secretion system secreted protein VgrG
MPDDTFIVASLDGEEEISALFNYQMGLLSDNHNIVHANLLGKAVTLSIYTDGNEKCRYVNGYINSLRMMDVNDDGLRGYFINVVPGLWFASLNSYNRIFQNKSAHDIINEVLKYYSNVLEFDFSLKKMPIVREYCVQFDETDLEFVHRLLSEEGISYYFKHEEKVHKLFFIDDVQGFFESDIGALDYDGGGSQPTRNSIHRWERNYSFHTNAVESFDYNEYATTNNYRVKSVTSSDLTGASRYTMRHFGINRFVHDADPKHAFDSNDNAARVNTIISAEEGQFDLANGTSDCGQLAVGGQFSIEHPLDSERGKYTVTRLTLTAREGNGRDTFFENAFECVPSTKFVRPLWLRAPKTIDAPQIATVEEVKATASDSSVDLYTQLKVKFPWHSEQCSCWVRVAQSFAGKNWGANFVPRIGQEVIVAYLNGDSSRPIVTGAVYNGTNQGPNYTATQSGWKTQYDSSKINEFRFDDEPEQEEVYMEAGKDHNWVVRNDQSGLVENNQTLSVTNNRAITVTEGNETTTIKKGNRSASVAKGDDIIQVDMGDRKVTLERGNHSVKTNVGKYSVGAKGGITLESVTSIELKCGSSTIKMTPAGITIKGIMLNCNGDAMVEVKAGGMLTLKGGITLIN